MKKKQSGRTRPWVVVLVLILAAAAVYVGWAKPKLLFSSGTAQSDTPSDSTAKTGRSTKAAAGNSAGGRGGGAGGPGGPGGRRGGQLAPVGVAKAHTADVDIYLSALGAATSANTVTVRSRVDGELMKVHFKEGETVKAGQLLAEVDPRAFQVQLGLAQAQLARDAAQLQNAKTDLQRYTDLLAQDSIARQQLDTQESLVRQYSATIKIDQAAIDSAKLQLTYSRITAPAGGRIGLRQVDVGNIVRSGDANGIAVITQVQPIDSLFTIPEVNVPQVLRRLQKGEKIVVEGWDREQRNKIATGVLLTADNQIDASTGTIKLKARFANEDLALFPNQFVNIRLLLETRRNATVVPTAAIQRGNSGDFVYVVRDDSTVTVRPVTTGVAQGQDTMIENGVSPGEVVVIDGTDWLKEGLKVEAILRAQEAAAPADGQGKRPRRGQGPEGPGGRAGGAGAAGGAGPGTRPGAGSSTTTGGSAAP